MLMLMLRYHQRGQELSALCVTGCVGLALAPVSWVPCWVDSADHGRALLLAPGHVARLRTAPGHHAGAQDLRSRPLRQCHELSMRALILAFSSV
jgi:hypothetical protein